MTVREACDFFALNDKVIEVDLKYDNGENAFLGLVYDYNGLNNRSVNEDAMNKYADCEVIRTETMVDRDDGTVCFDLIIAKEG
jgi:hypothetical protein